MKNIRILVLLVLTACTCSLNAKSYENQLADRVVEKTLDFKSGGEISLENINGQVKIVGTGREKLKVVANIHIRKIKDSEAARSLADAVEIKIEKKGRRLEISHEISKKNRSKDDNEEGGIDKFIRRLTESVSLGGSSYNSKVSIDYQIEVPKETDIEVNNVNGNLNLSSCNGKHDLNVVNGKIFLDDMQGKLKANVVNGKIIGERISASTDGNTVNGDIEFVMLISGDISLNTVNGDIEIRHKRDIGARLDASVMSGSISFKDADFRGEIRKKNVEGIYNGGGDSHWDLNCVNGDIDIKAIGEDGK